MGIVAPHGAIESDTDLGRPNLQTTIGNHSAHHTAHPAMMTVVTADDYYHAALLFQHGDTPDDASQAHTLALEAMTLGHPKARWLAAAAYDRWCMYQGKPQKYGTNYVTDGVRHRLWDVDPATTDTERAAWDVPPLTEQRPEYSMLCLTKKDPPLLIDDDNLHWCYVGIAVRESYPYSNVELS